MHLFRKVKTTSFTISNNNDTQKIELKMISYLIGIRTNKLI